MITTDSLEVLIPNASELAKNDPIKFTEIRRLGLGASDSSIVLGVNKWSSVEDLIAQKCSPTVTAEEIEVSKKPQVRMGNDLEPIVLQKFIEFSGFENVAKPEPMYQIKQYPWLTVNYDALTSDGIPVECKTVSMFADKVWGKDKCMKSIDEPKRVPISNALSIKDRVMTISEQIGIPPYYYTQCQQQMLGVGANHCYLTALFVKDWTLRTYYVCAEETVQRAIIDIGKTVWETIEASKKGEK